MHALLVTGDDRVIQEFQKIAAVTQTQLVITDSPSDSQIALAYRVFVAQDLETLRITHDEIVFVVVGATDSTTWQSALQLNANQVATIPDSRDWLIANLTAPNTNQGLGVAVIPAVGGAGASILASGLSFHARQLFRDVALVDADFDSAGLDLIYGLESQGGMRWHDFATLTGAIGSKDIFRSLPNRDGVGLITHGTLHCPPEALPFGKILEQLRGGCELVVTDLPRFARQRHVIEVLENCDVVLVTTPATVRGVATTKQLLSELNGRVSTVELVVRKIPGSNLDPLNIAEMLETPLAATISTDTRIVEQVEQGFGMTGIHLGGFTRSMNALAHRMANIREQANAA
jgi:secretion/DNA translocation related CpaE-like protein